MKEWIPEAMGMMRTKVTLKKRHADLDVKFYKAKLPCGLRKILAVEHNGARMRYFNGDKTFSSENKPLRHDITTGYISVPKIVSGYETLTSYTWSIDFTVPGAKEITAIYFDIASFRTIGITLNLGDSLTALIDKLNNQGLVVFTAEWIGNFLSIQTRPTNIEFHDILAGNTVIAPTTILVAGDEVQRTSAQEVDIRSVYDMGFGDATYYTELDYINTSFCDGKIRVYYNEIPIDKDGFPLIPDNQNYKQALYWYVRGMMIGAGFTDPVFSYDQCEARCERHMARAMGEITYPSVDQAMASMEASNRLIFNDGAFDNFFGDTSAESILY
jgi:hypothetical protein